MATLNNPEVDAGSLDKRVALLRPVYNAYQDEIDSWEPVGSVWAAMAPASGMEANEAGHTVAVTVVPVVIRYRSDIDARWRLSLGARVFEVEALVNVGERGAQLRLTCKEVL